LTEYWLSPRIYSWLSCCGFSLSGWWIDGRLLRYADIISSKAILEKATDVIADVYIQLVFREVADWQ